MSGKQIGRYEIIRSLGPGAMGVVYEGRDPVLQRRVAIKTIKLGREGAAADGYRTRFNTEALAAARLLHPNIVPVFDFGRNEDLAYLVMQYVEGDDLEQLRDDGERFSLAMIVSMVLDLLAALEHAHENNIVHGDVKPANLLIERGRLLLTDFGVARLLDGVGASATRAGAGIGTPRYRAPEQAQGRPVDARTDLFSAGVVLYELLAGERPFEGGTPYEIIHQIVNVDPPPPSTRQPALPPAFDAVLARALAKEPARRFGSAREFALALKSAGQGRRPVALPPASPLDVDLAGRQPDLAGSPAVRGAAATAAAMEIDSETLRLIEQVRLRALGRGGAAVRPDAATAAPIHPAVRLARRRAAVAVGIGLLVAAVAGLVWTLAA